MRPEYSPTSPDFQSEWALERYRMRSRDPVPSIPMKGRVAREINRDEDVGTDSFRSQLVSDRLGFRFLSARERYRDITFDKVENIYILKSEEN